MSAFVVGDEHINAMVSLAAWGPRDQHAPGNFSVAQWHRLSWFDLPWHALRALEGGDAEKMSHRRQMLDQPDDLNAVGRMLLLENYKSYNYRYQDTGGEDAARSYQHRNPAILPTAAEALMVISCYEYQSCEHPDWHDSEAAMFCSALRHALIGQLPGTEGVWEWTDARPAKRKHA